jgi:hypothetical protein
MSRLLTALAFVALAAPPAYKIVDVRSAFAASGDAECGEISWPVGRDRDAFARKDLPQRASGARLRRIDRAVELSLKQPEDVELFMRPAVAPDKQRFSGAVTFFGVPRPGLYQVTLSEPAEVEVFENGMRLKPLDSARAQNCPGVAQSARYQLAPGDLVLVEVINAPQPTIKVAFDQAETRTAW